MVESWLDITNFKLLYQVSDLGRVKSLTRPDSKGVIWPERILVPVLGSHGYLYVSLRKDSKTFNLLIHRLVAIEFLPNPLNKRTVNHKDGNKLFNVLSNLEWMSYSENVKHSFNNLGRVGSATGKFGKDNPSSKPIIQFDLNSNIITDWESCRVASRALGFNANAIGDACRGRNKTAYGFKWKFKKGL